MSEYIIEVSEWVIDANGNPPSGIGEEIVRCKDCKHYGYGKYATHCYRFVHKVDPDGFCAWGERKRGAKMDYDAAEYQAAINPNTDFDR